MANGNSKYTESNNVSIQMSTKLSSASFTFVDVNDPSKEVQLGQVDTVVGKTNGPFLMILIVELRNWKMQDMN